MAERRTGAIGRQIRVMPSHTMTRRNHDGIVCPNEHAHTLQPDRYLAWHEWANKKTKTHIQVRCPGCDRLSIWKPRG